METGEASTEVSLGEFTKIPTGEFINSKSYTFEVDTFMLCLTIALGIIGVLGNLTACFVLRRIKSQKINFLIGSQATIDLLVPLILLADACLLHRKIYRIPIPQQPTLGYIFCAFLYWDTILFCVFAASTYNFVAISIERYIAVLYPFLYSASFTRRKAVVMGCIAWMSAPIMQITYARDTIRLHRWWLWVSSAISIESCSTGGTNFHLGLFHSMYDNGILLH